MTLADPHSPPIMEFSIIFKKNFLNLSLIYLNPEKFRLVLHIWTLLSIEHINNLQKEKLHEKYKISLLFYWH